MAIIIFLNGCGSAGKTSIAKSIQYLSNKPWLRLSMDSLIDMMPSQYIAFGNKAEEGYFSFKSGINQHGPTVSIEEGPLGHKVFNCLPYIAKILVD